MKDKINRASNFFKNMDEVREYAENIKDKVSEEVYNDILFLLGLEENRALTTKVIINNKEEYIDCYIANIVEYLEEKGYQPLASCSGLQEEHQQSLHKPKQGYLAVKFFENYYKYLKDNFIVDGITIEKSECYLQPAITITVKAETDEGIKKLWEKLFEFIKR